MKRVLAMIFVFVLTQGCATYDAGMNNPKKQLPMLFDLEAMIGADGMIANVSSSTAPQPDFTIRGAQYINPLHALMVCFDTSYEPVDCVARSQHEGETNYSVHKVIKFAPKRYLAFFEVKFWDCTSQIFSVGVCRSNGMTLLEEFKYSNGRVLQKWCSDDGAFIWK